MTLEISENCIETSCGPRKPLKWYAECMFHITRAMLDFPAAVLAFHAAWTHALGNANTSAQSLEQRPHADDHFQALNISESATLCLLERLRNLPTLLLSRIRIFKFLPTDWKHCIARLTFRHDNPQLILGGGEIVIRLVS